ncbi:MAG: ADOP family duplicated permease [Gemmatimonadaceae bacterium]
MRTLKGIAAQLRAIVRGRAADAELDEEIRFHLELETEKNIASGMPPDEARRRALRAFGSPTLTREAHRDVRGAQAIDDAVGDVRFALRTLARGRALTLSAVITLALGVGASVAIWAAVNAVILRPLPFPHPDQLVMLWEENPEKNWHQETAAPANMLDWRAQVPAFQDVAAYNGGHGKGTLTGRGEPRLLGVQSVTGNFFAVLGVRAALGRTLADAETWRDAGPRVAVLSDRAWRDVFAADRDVIGRTVTLEGNSVQIVGVAPPDFAFPAADVDLWLPMGWDRGDVAQTWFRRAHWIRPIARLRPGVSLEAANAQLQQVVGRLKREYPATNKLMGAGLTPLHAFLVGDTRRPLLILLGAVSLLLLLACANVANLLLVRAAARERETAVRLALGARRGRLARQAFTESLVLSALGGAAGAALGWAGTRALAALQPPNLLRVQHFDFDLRVLGFVLAVMVATGLLFGIAPALWSARRAPAEALRAGGRTGSDGRRARRWGDALVVGEVALALMLTVGAGLLVRSFMALRSVDPGFDPRGVLAVGVSLPDVPYDSPPKARRFFDELERRTRALPGVQDAALVTGLPLTHVGWSSDFTIAGRPAGEYGSEVRHRSVSPGYFRTMRVKLLRGRDFTADDRSETTPVVILNEEIARRFFKGQDPIGQRLSFDRVPDSTSMWRTIVGVVASEHQAGLGEDPRIEIFAPLAQEGGGSAHLVVRATAEQDGAAAALAPAVRRVLAELEPSIAPDPVTTMERVRERSLARDRFFMTLLLAFAAVGLALAVVGVYGVLAQLARRRTHEMGIRIALGARPAAVRWLVVRHGLALTCAGLAVGTLVALALTRTMRALLFRTPPSDAVTFAVVGALLALTGVAASWLPARKASRADPVAALRGA